MDGHCLPPYTRKYCVVFKQFDGLNFDGLAGSLKNVKILRYTVIARSHALCITSIESIFSVDSDLEHTCSLSWESYFYADSFIAMELKTILAYVATDHFLPQLKVVSYIDNMHHAQNGDRIAS